MKLDVSQFGSLLTWWWLPSVGSQLVLNVCYSLQIVSTPPPSAYRLRNNHLQLARTAVILGTLLYQLYISVATAEPNYYRLLGLPLDVDAEGVKRSFRALARKYHPDKVGEAGQAFFIVLRRAHDALSDPVKRFAYDRFGPSIADWKDCESARDFMRRGLTSLVAFYTINPAMYAIFGYTNGSQSGISFWRLACLFALLAVELSMLVSPEYPMWLAVVLPNTTIYDVRQLGHALFVNFFFASLQLSAALDVLEYGEEGAPPRDRASKGARMEKQFDAVRVKAQSVNQAAELVAKGALQSFASELRPFRNVGEQEQQQQQEQEEQVEMGVEEAKLFERIDAVLLSRSLMQQHPQLVQLATKEEVQAKPEELRVKKEEQGKEEELAPLPQVESSTAVVKEEAVEVSLAEQPTTEAYHPEVGLAESIAPKEDGIGSALWTEKEETVYPAGDTPPDASTERQQEAGEAGTLESTPQEPTPRSASTEPWVHLEDSSQPQKSEAQSVDESTGQRDLVATDTLRSDTDASSTIEPSQDGQQGAAATQASTVQQAESDVATVS